MCTKISSIINLPKETKDRKPEVVYLHKMTFVYTVFFIEWEACKDFLRDIRFPSRSQIEVHVFHRKDADQNQLRSLIPDKKHHDGRAIVAKHSSLTSFPNAVEDLLVYYASSFDFSRFKKPDVYLVSGEGRRYEELAKILRKDKRVSAWVIDGRRTTLLDWLDANCVCKMCKFVFDSAHEGVQHYDEFHMK